jgi:histidyl-tRNA synthetase
LPLEYAADTNSTTWKLTSMAEKIHKLKARLPRGLSDRGPGEIAATRRMLDDIRKVYEHYGFEPVETPAIEYTDALGKFLPDQDRPNEGVFSFQDDDEQWLSLRYDLTAPLARYVAENFDALPKPYRSYRYGWVFRNEKPGPGRYRQFMQFDADTVGSASPAADAEMCMMAADTMDALGFRDTKNIPAYVIKINSRKVLDGLMESIQLGGADNAMKRIQVLRAVDKKDRLGINGVRALLGEGRRDDSGDITKGAGLSKNQIDKVMAYVMSVAIDWRQHAHLQSIGASDSYSHQKVLNEWRAFVGDTEIGKQAIEELSAIAELVEASGYSDRVKLASDVVRGLEYYTGPVLEVELTFEVPNEKGQPVVFGSVAGGGRYDGLVARFRGEPVPATGFSIGVSRLMAALTHLGKIETKPAPGPVVVTVFDPDRIADYQRMVASLRAAGIRAELYLGQGKFGPQMKYADKRGSPCVVIQGPDEKNDPAGPQVVIKDLIIGAELAKLEKGREEYLQKQAEAQRKVPEGQLVEAVRAVLARHGVVWR